MALASYIGVSWYCHLVYEDLFQSHFLYSSVHTDSKCHRLIGFHHHSGETQENTTIPSRPSHSKTGMLNQGVIFCGAPAAPLQCWYNTSGVTTPKKVPNAWTSYPKCNVSVFDLEHRYHTRNPCIISMPGVGSTVWMNTFKRLTHVKQVSQLIAFSAKVLLSLAPNQ